MKRVKPWLELVRLPNCFTAMTDVLAGAWLVGAFGFTPSIALLALGSACLYAFGIVLNDIADVEIDRTERPQRPLPSGRVSMMAAKRLAFGLVVAGFLLVTTAGWLQVGNTTTYAPVLRLMWVSAGLVVAIGSYDLLAKETPIGPVVMGLCRALNLALGMSLSWTIGWNEGLIPIAALGFYVSSLTFFGRQEAETSSRWRLATGAAGILLAIAVLGVLIADTTMASQRYSGDYFLLVLWLAFMIHVGRKALAAIRQPTPQHVGRAMKVFILGIVVFDALLAAGAHGWIAAVIILAFLLPALLLGRRVYST